jgi:hypothetical protein
MNQPDNPSTSPAAPRSASSRWIGGLVLRGLGAFLFANTLLLYLPVSAVSMAGIAVVAVFTLFVDYRKMLLVAISFLFVTGVLEIVARWGVSESLSPYWRAHEMLALETSYRPNERVEMDVQHGDMLVIDPKLSRSMAVPRHEVFKTDSQGYRNDADYSGEKLVLVGDSYLVGTETHLAAVLRTEFKVPAYNVSFSGSGPLIYADKIQWVRTRLAPSSCVILFFFEGNDFRPGDQMGSATRTAVPRGFQLAVKNYVNALRGSSKWSRVFYGLATRSYETIMASRREGGDASGAAAGEPISFLRQVGGKPMAFLRGYAEVVQRPSYDDFGFIKDRLSFAKPDVVVFIPDKYRVYAGLIDDSPVTGLPHAQWAYLKSAADNLKIPAIDLTPHLVDRSIELLPQNLVTYWRDDTHWNVNGERVAARVLLDALASSPQAKCQVDPGRGR